MKTFKYKHHIFAALRDLNVTYYTSPVDFIVIQYNGGWIPYDKFREVKAFNHMPQINYGEMLEDV